MSNSHQRIKSKEEFRAKIGARSNAIQSTPRFADFDIPFFVSASCNLRVTRSNINMPSENPECARIDLPPLLSNIIAADWLSPKYVKPQTKARFQLVFDAPCSRTGRKTILGKRWPCVALFRGVPFLFGLFFTVLSMVIQLILPAIFRTVMIKEHFMGQDCGQRTSCISQCTPETALYVSHLPVSIQGWAVWLVSATALRTIRFKSPSSREPR